MMCSLETNDGGPCTANEKCQIEKSLCHGHQQGPVNDLLNEIVETVMAEQNGFVAVPVNAMDFRSNVGATSQREGITVLGFAKTKQELERTKEFSNISTKKLTCTSESISGRPYPPENESIFNANFNLECKQINLNAGEVLDLSFAQSAQRTEFEGTCENINISNKETVPNKPNSKSMIDVEIKPDIIESNGGETQWPQDAVLNNNSAIDLSLRIAKKEPRKDTATEGIENTSHPKVIWQKQIPKRSHAKIIRKEEIESHNQYSREIRTKYEHNAISLVKHSLARTKCPLKGNSIALSELIIKEEEDLNGEQAIESHDNSPFSINETNQSSNNYSTFEISSAAIEDKSSKLKRNSLTAKKKKIKEHVINGLRILRKTNRTRQRKTYIKESINKNSKRT